MGLKRTVVLGRGNLPLPHERQMLDRLAQELPDGYPIWTGLTLFDPSGQTYEIDAVVLGHHAVYVVELKTHVPAGVLPATVEQVTHIGQLVKMALAQQLSGNPPWVESLVVLPKETANLPLSTTRDSHVVTSTELLGVILSGKLPGAQSAPSERPPLGDAFSRKIAEVFGGLRRRIRPGRGNLVQELQFLQRDLVVDLKASAPNSDPLMIEEAASLWILAMVFVRVLVERGFLDKSVLAPESKPVFDARLRLGGAREYLRFTLDQVAASPACTSILSPLQGDGVPHPSSDTARDIYELLRLDGGTGVSRWNFAAHEDRLWCELYSTLAEPLVKRHGTLQTPEFVARFLLAHTLEPAVKTFGIDHVRVIDPACGSGDILIVAFKKLCDMGVNALDAIDRVCGVDISPMATMITRMRLFLAYVDQTNAKNIEDIPALPIHVETANSLLEPNPESLLAERYPVVVCNPPYVTEKDSDLDARYRRLYRSAMGRFSLVTPFVERGFQLATANGYVGMIVSGSFAKREFGRALVEDVLSQLELTHVIDSSGAFIPGHVPTMMLFGRNRLPTTDTIRIVAKKKGEPISPMVPEEGKVWLALTGHVEDAGYEDEYVVIRDVPRETMSRHPWILGSRAEQSLLERLKQEPQTLSTFGARVRIGSQSGLDAVFVLPPDVPRRLSFEAEVIRSFVNGESVRDYGVSPRHAAIAPYRFEDEKPVAVTEDERWLRFLWKYRAVLESRAEGAVRRSRPWWTWQKWVGSADVSQRIICPRITRYNQFAWVRGRIATAPSVCVIDLPSTCTDEDALVLLGWLNSSTACFYFRQVTLQIQDALRFDPSVLDSIPVPSNLVCPGSTREKVIALAKQLDALARLLEEQYAPARVLERWDGSSRDGLMDLLGEAQMRDQNLRRKMVCHQEELDWVVYDALGLTQETIVPIASSASPEQRPFAWLTDDCPRGLQRPLVDAWQRRRRALRANPLLAVLETPTYKRPFKDVAGNDTDEDEIDDGPSRARPKKNSIDYWERTAKACEVWMLERVERVFRDHEPRLLSAEALITKLGVSTAPGIVASVWGSRRSRVTTLAEMLDELLLEHAVSALVSERYTASGLEKRAEWRALWALQRCEDAGEVVSELPVSRPFERSDYRDAVSYRLRGAWDVPTERLLVHRDERSHELRYGWAGWTDEQKTAVFSGLGEL